MICLNLTFRFINNKIAWLVSEIEAFSLIPPQRSI